MFDSVKIDIKCPYCGKTSEMEAQTKELDCNLEVWKKGDFVTDKFNELDCLTDCEKCNKFIDVIVFLDKGKVSGKYKAIKN